MSLFLSPEEEEDLVSTVLLATPKNNKAATNSLDDDMNELEASFESAMQTLATAAVNKSDELRAAYAEVHAKAQDSLVDNLKLAMQDIPEGTKGLKACKEYFSQKQFYTMLDILVAQYVLNDGLLMRQHHDLEDEYHVDIAEPLACCCDDEDPPQKDEGREEEASSDDDDEGDQ